MKYIDRDGNPITAEDWAKLFRNRRYALVREDGDGHECVITSWVGVLSDLDPNHDLYLIERQEKSYSAELGLDRWRTVEEFWRPTEKAARTLHVKLLGEIRRKNRVSA
jgi:hypothetical protein